MTYDTNNFAAILLKEQDDRTPKELLLLEQWYNSLNDKTQLNKFNNTNKEVKKAAMWSAITSEIDKEKNEETSILKLKQFKSAFYYIFRIAAMLILLAGSYVTFNFFNNKTIDTTQYISKINNTNKPAKIILPDNSMLWLESKSSIKYPARFSEIRNISLLEGKVFFNITHDSSKPFIVETDNGLKTTVLGTAFVIEKENNSNSVKISVLRGKVQVFDNIKKYATLLKNQGVVMLISNLILQTCLLLIQFNLPDGLQPKWYSIM